MQAVQTRLHQLSVHKSNFKKLYIFILIVRNIDFNGKIASNSFSKWLSKYNHYLFRISRQPKIDSKNSSLECKQDIEKLLENEDVQSKFYVHNSSNDDLKSEIQKNSLRCSKSLFTYSNKSDLSYARLASLLCTLPITNLMYISSHQ